MRLIDADVMVRDLKKLSAKQSKRYGQNDISVTMTNAIIADIEAMPTVEPQRTYTDAEIQKMQDLEQAQFDTMYRLGYEEGKEATQRITGHWIKTEKYGEPTLCSICGTRWDTDYVESRELYYTGKIPKFCPECGNRMEVIKNGNERTS